MKLLMPDPIIMLTPNGYMVDNSAAEKQFYARTIKRWFVKQELKQHIGRFLFQANYSRGDALAHWQRNSHIVNNIEKLYNSSNATKSELITALESLIEIAKGATNPRFRLDNQERIEAALSAIKQAQTPLWRKWYEKIKKASRI